VECKRVDAARLTPSIRTALETLELAKLLVIYAGHLPYPLAENIQVIPLTRLADNPTSLLVLATYVRATESGRAKFECTNILWKYSRRFGRALEDSQADLTDLGAWRYM
jgi:hypothetical protein